MHYKCCQIVTKVLIHVSLLVDCLFLSVFNLHRNKKTVILVHVTDVMMKATIINICWLNLKYKEKNLICIQLL